MVISITYLGAGTPGDVGGPEVEVRSVLPALEEQALVAILHLGQLVHSEVGLAAPARKLEKSQVLNFGPDGSCKLIWETSSNLCRSFIKRVVQVFYTHL